MGKNRMDVRQIFFRKIFCSSHIFYIKPQLKQLNDDGRQELIVKKNFGREGQHALEEMAHQHGLYL